MHVGEIRDKENISNFLLLGLQNFRRRLPGSTLSTSATLGCPYQHNGLLYSFFSWREKTGWEQCILPYSSPHPRQPLSSDSAPSVSTVVLKVAEQSCWRADAFWAQWGQVLWKEGISCMQQGRQCRPAITCIHCTSWKRLLRKECRLFSFVSSRLPNTGCFFSPLIASSHSACLLSTFCDGDTNSIEPCWSLKFPSMRQINSIFFLFFSSFFFFPFSFCLSSQTDML